MEAKKNPDKDVYKKSGQYFLIGLSISTAIMITVFEWKTELIPTTVTYHEPDMPIVLPEIPQPKTESPKSMEEPILKLKPTSPSFTPIEVANHSSEKNAETTPTIDADSLAYTGSTLSMTDDPEVDTAIYIFVEKKPEPVNGFEGFYKDVSERTKYPRKARQLEVEGKVYIEFVVNKKGEPTDFKVMKGIGSGCDEEAMRVIALSKWEPGKQRGKPVRVKMVMPIAFKLGQ